MSGHSRHDAYVVGVYDSLGSVEDLKELYEQYPESIRDLLGGGRTSAPSTVGFTRAFLSWLPLVSASTAAYFSVAGNISKEAEQRTLDFTSDSHYSRSFVVSRLVAGLFNLAVLTGSIWLIIVVEVAAVGHDPATGKYALALLNAYLLGAALAAGMY